MTAPRWQQAQALYLEAERLPAEARSEFLDRACGADGALRADVENLLQQEPETRAAAEPRTEAEARDAVELPAGMRLGPWQVIRLAGRGGMGEVYEARRADGAFDLRAAVKLLKRGLDTGAVVARFNRERRILARLDHPNIARVLDAGAAPDGRPFLVMEYVDGKPLTEWIRGHELPLADLLRIMVTVCEAVQAAHAQNIVHRDLKPSNVLVTAQGQVKLLDFGIAKLLAEEEVDATRLAGEAGAMTPAYAAPEQILGGPPSPATDVYALGVMLYELLAGRPPHRRQGRSMTAIAAELTRETVLRPSTVLRRERGRLPEAERGQRLRRVAGDLDLIVMKALHAEVARRYANAGALAEDLQRFLEHRPVMARPDSTFYRMRRFVRRNRLAVAAAGTVLLALSVGLALALWQAGIARTQARRALQQQQRAERVKDFMLSVFQEQDPYRHRTAQQRTPLQLIDEATKRVDTGLGADAELHAELLGELAEIRYKLGDEDGARPMLQRARREATGLYGADSVQVAHLYVEEGRVEDRQKGDQAPEVAADAREALAILNKLGQTDTMDVADAKLLLGRALGASDAQTAQALVLLTEALAIYRQRVGADSTQAIDSMIARASVLVDAQRMGEAETLLRDANARLEKSAGGDNLALGYPLSLLAYVLNQQGRSEEAIPILQRVAQLRRKELGDHAKGLADTLGRLGLAYYRVNRYDQGEVAFLEAERAVPAGDDFALQESLDSRMSAELHAQRWPQALEAGERDFALTRRLYGDSSTVTWRVAANLGWVRSEMGDAAGAERVLEQARAGMLRAAGPESYDNWLPATATGAMWIRRGDYRRAVEPLRQAFALAQKHLARTSLEWAQAAANLAEALVGVNDPPANAEAGPLLDEAIAVMRGLDDKVTLGQTLLRRGVLRSHTGDRAGATADLKECLLLLEADAGNWRKEIDEARRMLARS